MRIKTNSIIILILALLPLLLAYGVEYLLDIVPCRFCIYQRIPYVIIGMLAAIRLLAPVLKRYDVAINMALEISMIASFCLSLFHYGLEKKLFTFSSDCVNNLQMAKTFEDFKASLMKQEYVSCDQISFEILGMPMSLLNIVYSIFFFLLIVKLNEKNAQK
jgi:disulfide bond formation protein DsbB